MPEEEKTEELTEEQIAAAAAAEEAAAEEVKEKTYAELGLNERYDSMTREQLAEDIKSRNTSFGHQTEVVGQLREQLQTYEEQLAGVKKAADLPAEVKAAAKKMSPQELDRWLQDLQTDPHAAIRGLLGDNFGRRSDDELSKLIEKQVNEGLQGYHGYTEEQAVRADPDYPVFANYIEYLQKPEHFGNTRSPRELLEFGRLITADKEAGNAVYDAMKRFPGVPMKECIHMVNGRPKANVDADKIRREVDGLAGGGLPGGSKTRSKVEKIEGMHDAFHPDEE